MRKTLLIVTCLITTIPAILAQSLVPSLSTDPVWFGTESDSSSALAWGDYSIQSSAIQQSFLNKFVFGGYINDELKDKVNGNLRESNRVFYSSDAGAGYFSKTKSKNNRYSRWYLLLRNQQFTQLKFPPQLFQIVFYGNGSDKTEQGNFSNTKASHMSGNRLDVGWHQHWFSGNGRKWAVSANAGVMQINSQWELDWPRGQLSTEPNGSAISFDNKATFQISDTSQYEFFGPEGWGIAGDLQVSATNGAMDWYLTVKDLGKTWMNESSLELTLDTAYTYRGGDLNKILSGESNLFPSGDRDSLLNLIGARARKGSFSGNLPALISVVGQRHINSWDIMGGINYRIGVHQLPLFFATVGYEDQSIGMHYGATVAYGGAGMFRLGLQLQKTFNNRIKFHLGLNNLNALVLPSTFSGFSAFGVVRYRL